MTETRVTPRPWEVERFNQVLEIVSGTESICEVSPYRQARVMGIASSKNIAEGEANAQLIISAVEACRALNPTDPLAAAQHLEALVTAAQTVVDESAAEFKDERMNYEVWQITNGVLETLKAALSRVTGKR